MKANLIVHCSQCGETSFTLMTKPGKGEYEVYCDACDACVATIPSYGLDFGREEDTNANTTP